MKFITFGKDVIGGLEEQALEPIFSKVKNEGMNEIVILAHSSTENIGGHDVKSFVKHIENIKEFNKGDSEEVKHIYLLGCEVGFVNEKGESLAQEIADEFARSSFLKTGYKNIVVHAISNNKTEYVGMRVEVVSQAGKLHSQIEKMQDGHVRAFGYKTKKALDCEDRLSFLNTEIPKIFKELPQMPEYIDNNGTKNIQKTKKREELEELRKEETKLLKQREELVQNKVIETIVATNDPYQDICRNTDYEFRPKGQKLSLQLVQNDNQPSKRVKKVQDLPNEVQSILKALDNEVSVQKKGFKSCKEKLSSAGENWKLVLQEITHALKYHEKRTSSPLYICLKAQCKKFKIDYNVGIYNKAKEDKKTPKIEKENRVDESSRSSRSSEWSFDIEEIKQVNNKEVKKEGGFFKNPFKKKDKKEKKEDINVEKFVPIPERILKVVIVEQNVNFDIKHMAEMVSEFTYGKFLDSRKEGDSKAAKSKMRFGGSFFKPDKERVKQIEDLRLAAVAVMNFYRDFATDLPQDENEAKKEVERRHLVFFGTERQPGIARDLLNLVFTTKLTLVEKQKKYWRQSNLLTNLEQVLDVSRAPDSKNIAMQLVESETKKDNEPQETKTLRDTYKQLMFKDALKVIKDEEPPQLIVNNLK